MSAEVDDWEEGGRVFCPLLSISSREPKECLKSACAWFVETDSEDEGYCVVHEVRGIVDWTTDPTVRVKIAEILGAKVRT